MLDDPGNNSGAVPDELKQVSRTPCARMSSEDIFVGVCEVVWSYLRHHWDTKKHIRVACRHGRQLHDRMCTSLTLDLSKTTKVPHADIRTTLSGMVQRGARFQIAEVKFNTEGSHNRQRKQLLAALPAFGTPHLTTLELRGIYWINPYMAAKIASSCPAVTSLTLDNTAQGMEDDEPSSEGEEDDAGVGPAMCPPPRLTTSDIPCAFEGLAQARILLLQEMGPRLTDLTLKEADGWWTESLQALRHCRALKDLYIDAGENTLIDLDHQSDILESVSQLPQLEILQLEFTFNAPKLPLTDIPARDICSFSHLGALTSLTHLYMERNPYYMQDEAAQLAWDQVWPAQREVLVAALRQLTIFGSSTLTLRVSDLAALTSLKSVELAGLEAPGPTEQQQPAAMGAGTAARGPHQLLEIAVGRGSYSLRALPCLGAFPLLRGLQTGVSSACWRFGLDDLAPGGTQLLPDTPQVVRQAVRALADLRARAGTKGRGLRSGTEPLRITTDVDELLLPPEPAPVAASPAAGHAAWLRELGPLAAPGQEVQLCGLALTAGDLTAIADIFPDAKALDFQFTYVPVAALPCLGHMRQLQQLKVDVRQGGEESAETLCSALFATCQCCTRLQAVEVVCARSDELRGLCGEVQRAVADSGRGQVQVVPVGFDD